MESSEISTDVGVVQIRLTDVGDGDYQVVAPVDDLDERRRDVVDAPWTWLRQVHGSDIVEVRQPGEHAGSEADGAWTSTPGCPIAVTTADCAAVVLVADNGVAVVHAGWRGLVSGIVERAGARLLADAGNPVDAIVGPCIHPESYQFGEGDLSQVAEIYGPEVRGRTRTGDLALNMPAAVAAACRSAGWPTPTVGECTSSDRYFSHRTRGDQGRQTVVAWIEE